MKKASFGKRIISFVLLLSMTAVMIAAPCFTIKSEAASPMVTVPASTVGVSKIHAGATLGGTIFSGISLTIKGIGAIKYASDNSDGSFGDWTKLALAYFSGNAAENEQYADLKASMLAQFETTNASIKELDKKIVKLGEDIGKLQTLLEKLSDQTVANNLSQRLDKFYSGDTGFYQEYKNLIDAYSSLKAELEVTCETDEAREQNAANIKYKMDYLYAKAYEMHDLTDSITGNGFFDNKGILDTYYEYIMLTTQANSENPTEEEMLKLYAEVVATCQGFVEKLYAADAFQQFVIAYTSSYQYCYFNENKHKIPAGEFYGYTVNATFSGTQALSTFDIQTHIAEAHEESAEVSAAVAGNLSRLYRSVSFAGYEESSAFYYAPISSNKLSVYSGASYYFYPLPDAIRSVFKENFTFVADDGVEIDPSGKLTVTDSTPSSFNVYYVYGEETLDEALTVYTIKCTKADKKLSGGYGNLEAPYLISSVSDLQAFTSGSAYHASGVHTKLIANLDLSEKSISTVSNYYGHFEGDGRTISNLNRNSGIFNNNYGTITGLTLLSASISQSGVLGGGVVGGIVNTNQSGGIINACRIVSSTVHAYHGNWDGASAYNPIYSIVGGIAGENYGTIKGCDVLHSTMYAEASNKTLYDAGRYISEDITFNLNITVGGVSGGNYGHIQDCYLYNSEIKSQAYATYTYWTYFIVVVPFTEYNKVHRNVYYGIISGKGDGTYANNTHSDAKSSSDRHPIAQYTWKCDVKSGLVTGNAYEGNNGTAASSPKQSYDYIKSINVYSNPVKSLYRPGEILNPAALEIVDSDGKSIYGAKIYHPDSITGEMDVFVSYQDKTTGFTVGASCPHNDIAYEEYTPPTCLTDGLGASIYCNTCTQHINGYETIPKSDEYCKDTNSDHKCDLCSRSLSACTDSNDHLCDLCGKTVSVCKDDDKNHFCDLCQESVSNCSDGDSNHKCDICSETVSVCGDENSDHKCDLCGEKISNCSDSDDHLCDTCGEKISSCADGDSNHKCDVCGETLSACGDENSDHKCDLCGTPLSVCGDENSDHKCDLCGERISNCSDNDDHKCDTCGETVSVCSDNNDHFCDVCGVRVSTCSDNDNHLCDVCGVRISNCADGDDNHLCDICGVRLSNCADDNYDHNCDLCGAKLSDHSDTDRNHVCDYCNQTSSVCSDSDDHKCDICGETLSVCGDENSDHKCDVCGTPLTVCGDENSDHKCDLCGTKLSDCNDTDNDHFCNICKEKISDCTDADDHLCDICEEKVSDCTDADDHKCDVCKAVISACADENSDHNCDICGTPLTVCGDENSDHNCDICGAKFSDHSDTDNDHFCNICKEKISDCTDTIKDHLCDVCGKELSDCTDTDDHLCDICGNKLSEHKDTDRDHFCDICSEKTSSCSNSNADHLCDTCGAKVSVCTDEDGNKICDLCGEEFDGRLGVGAIVAIISSSITGVSGIASGLWFLIRKKKHLP